MVNMILLILFFFVLFNNKTEIGTIIRDNNIPCNPRTDFPGRLPHKLRFEFTKAKHSF